MCRACTRLAIARHEAERLRVPLPGPSLGFELQLRSLLLVMNFSLKITPSRLGFLAQPSTIDPRRHVVSLLRQS